MFLTSYQKEFKTRRRVSKAYRDSLNVLAEKMAHAANIGALTDELVAIITGYSPTNNASGFKACRDAASKNLRHHRYGRTNQFNVQSNLQGLVEKLRVLNNDTVADALQQRLEKIPIDKGQWTPEIFSLLLHLSDKPAEKSHVVDLDALRPPTPPPPLTWTEILADDPFEDSSLWDEVDFQAASSDDETLPTSDPHSDDTVESAISSQDDDPLQRVQSLIIPLDDAGLNLIGTSQSWRTTSGTSQPISELQAIRETLHLLLGQPSALFETQHGSGRLVPNMQFYLEDCSCNVYEDFMRRFADIATSINSLREYVLKPQRKPLLQRFTASLGTCVQLFDQDVARLEKRYINADGPVIVSILALSCEIEPISALPTKLKAILDSSLIHMSVSPYKLLDELYDQIYLSHAVGNEEESTVLTQTFLHCLQTYLKPVERWILVGDLSSEIEDFFIVIDDNATDKGSFWQGRFKLKEAEGGGFQVPSFMQHVVPDIFASGKSAALTRELGLDTGVSNIFHGAYNALVYATLPNLIPTLLPLSESIRTALSVWVHSNTQAVARPLRDYLFADCGLLQVVDALETLYLAADGALFDAFADALFSRIDAAAAAGTTNWANRFVLEDLARSTLGTANAIDAHALALAPIHDTTPRRTVKTLARLTLTYSYPWPVANVILPATLPTYQALFTLLLQLHRGATALARVTLRPLGSARNTDVTSLTALHVRHRLAHIFASVRSHLAHMAIAAPALALRARLRAAPSIDGMIAAHAAFVGDVASRGLLAAQLKSARDALLSMCDMAVLFGDVEAGRTVGRSGEGESAQRARRIAQMKGQLGQLTDLVIGELREKGRAAGGDACWELLAEELEWSRAERT